MKDLRAASRMDVISQKIVPKLGMCQQLQCQNLLTERLDLHDIQHV